MDCSRRRSIGGASDSHQAYISSLADHVMSRFNFSSNTANKRRKPRTVRSPGEKVNKKRRECSPPDENYSTPSIGGNISSVRMITEDGVNDSSRQNIVPSSDPINCIQNGQSNNDNSSGSADSQSVVSVSSRDSIIDQSGQSQCNVGSQSAVGDSSRDLTIDQSEQSGWAQFMPVELLSLVFAEVCEREGGAIPALCRLARVCRLWRSASQLSRMWRCVDLSRVPVSSRTSRRLAWLIKHRLSHVQHLSLEGWSKTVSDSTVLQLCSVCDDLRSLNVTGCSRLTAESFERLARDCPRLTSLTLTGLHARSCRVSFISDVVGVCRSTATRLEELCLSGNSVTTLRPLLHALVQCCSNLRVLDISNVTQRCGAALSVDIASLQTGCPRLHVLRWANTGITVSERSPAPLPITSSDSQAGFSELQEFSTAMLQENSYCVTDSTLWRVLFNSGSLRLLDVRGCHRLSAAALLSLPAVSGSRLQQLYLSSCSNLLRDDQLVKLLHQLSPVITHLEICSFLHDPQLLTDSLAALTADHEHCPPLVSLNVANSAISPQSLILILNRCVNLRVLDLTSCRLLERGVKRRYDGDLDILCRRMGVAPSSSHHMV